MHHVTWTMTGLVLIVPNTEDKEEDERMSWREGCLACYQTQYQYAINSHAFIEGKYISNY